MNSIIKTNNPAANTSPMSMILSQRNARGVVTPQAVFIPFLTALKAADYVHTRPKKLAMPVIALALIIPSIVLPTKSLEIGNTSAISLANVSLLDSVPIMNPRVDITARPKGNIEKRA